MKLLLSDIYDLAWRYVPAKAADDRLYTSGYRSWWPAHEIGHFLVATAAECQQYMFGIDDVYELPGGTTPKRYRYLVTREIAATSISQRLLRRSWHIALADEEIQYTSEDTLECSFERWCKSTVKVLLRANKTARLPTTRSGLEALLSRKAHTVGTTTYATLQSAKEAHHAAGAQRR